MNIFDPCARRCAADRSLVEISRERSGAPLCARHSGTVREEPPSSVCSAPGRGSGGCFFFPAYSTIFPFYKRLSFVEGSKVRSA